MQNKKHTPKPQTLLETGRWRVSKEAMNALLMLRKATRIAKAKARAKK